MSVSINGTNGLTFNDASVQNTAATGFGFKNRIINGAMMIDQRNAGASITANNALFAVDRFRYNSSQSSKGTIQQNAGAVTPPVGFTNYLGFTSSSAYSVLAADYFTFFQRIEGLNTADLAWGTANAATVTLSFKVYSSLTGTFGGSITNSAENRSYPFSYSIASANTWTTISITIPGDTTGTWLTTNGLGLSVNFGLGVGSTYGSGTAGAWTGSTVYVPSGSTSVVGTNGATWYVTGVQLEKGSTATSFDYRPYGTEMQLCLRYYEKSYDVGTVPGTATRNNMCFLTSEISASNREIPVRFTVEKRASPTVTVYSANLGNINTMDTSATYIQAASLEFTSAKAFAAYCTTAGYWVMLHYTASAEL